jgi:hypothetical protein
MYPLGHRLLPFILIATNYFGFVVSPSVADVVLDDIRNKYLGNLSHLHHAFVHWESVEVLMKQGSLQTPLFNSDCRFAIDGQKTFIEIRKTQTSGALLPQSQVNQLHRAMSYDGKETRILLFAHHARIFPTDERKQFHPPVDFFALQGYPKSQFRIWVNNRYASCDMASILRTEGYSVKGSTDINGIPCVRVDGPLDQIYLDKEHGFAIRQRVLLHSPSGRPAVRYAYEDLTEVQEGFWLGQRITVDKYETIEGSPTNTLKIRTLLEVKALNFERVPDSVFSLRFDPATSVEDARHFPKKADGSIPTIVYRTPAKPEDLDHIIAATVDRNRSYQMQAARERAVRWGLILLNSIVVIILLVVVIRRRYQTT